ncbi:YfiR family protein [Reichenbachiella versicolor]|uniref:YfiR family protein n=1 Tax=Reichenbachiella versicolor TaxID=1821036 RepID=UPI000D6E3CAB|nr:YfiR family protein [Reichenbachiella versicolor]
MKTRKTLFIICFLSIVSLSASAQESKFKALFIYKFAEYIEWPSSPSKIVVGVAGKSDVFNQLSTFAASKDNLEVKNISSASDSKSCNIIFLPNAQSGQLNSYVSTINGNSILLVTENSKLVPQGADIGFYLEQGKLRFLINKGSIESKKMVPSSKLLALGKAI